MKIQGAVSTTLMSQLGFLVLTLVDGADTLLSISTSGCTREATGSSKTVGWSWIALCVRGSCHIKKVDHLLEIDSSSIALKVSLVQCLESFAKKSRGGKICEGYKGYAMRGIMCECTVDFSTATF